MDKHLKRFVDAKTHRIVSKMEAYRYVDSHPDLKRIFLNEAKKSGQYDRLTKAFESYVNKSVVPGAVTLVDETAKQAGLAQRAMNRAARLTEAGYGISAQAAKQLHLGGKTIAQAMPALQPLVNPEVVANLVHYNPSHANVYDAAWIKYAQEAAVTGGKYVKYLSNAKLAAVVTAPLAVVGAMFKGLEYQLTPAPKEEVKGRLAQVKAFLGTSKDTVAGYLIKDAMRNGKDAVVTGVKNNKVVTATLVGMVGLSAYNIYKSGTVAPDDSVTQEVTPIARQATPATSEVAKVTVAEIVRTHGTDTQSLIKALKANGYKKSGISKQALQDAGLNLGRAEYIMSIIG